VEYRRLGQGVSLAGPEHSPPAGRTGIIRRYRLREDSKCSTGGDLALWYALNGLMAAYWADVDENGGLQAHEFYLPEGLFVIGNNRFEGREKIAAFYTVRRHSAIATRHLLTNLRPFGDNLPDGRDNEPIPRRR
jgi:hypothetical protein